MNNLNIKAENRIWLNKAITKFYNGLVENLKYIVCSKVNPIDAKTFINFMEVEDFVNKEYVSNKYRKAFTVEIDKAKNEINTTLNLTDFRSQCDKIESRFDELINGYSDMFQGDLNKKVSELIKKDPNQINNFKQGLYNMLVDKIEKDFNNLGLPEIYRLDPKHISTNELK